MVDVGREETELARTCLLLFGPPGVGKGTQAVLLAAALSMPHVVASDLLRRSAEMIKERALVDLETEIAHGRVLPDDVVVDLLLNRIMDEDCRDGVLVDGFPYTLGQAVVFADAVELTNWGYVRAIYLDAPKTVLVSRIARRRSEATSPDTTAAGRADDAPAIAIRRISTYLARIAEVVSYYRSTGVLHEVDADRRPRDVHKDLFDTVASLFGLPTGEFSYIEGHGDRS